MHFPVRRACTVALFTCSTLFAGLAQAQDGLQVSLTARRVTTDDRGRETFVAADQAKPGEIVEYRAVYHNLGTSAVREVAATLPIPAGTELVRSTARPARMLASVDGVTFAAPPLKRKERLADGREVEREIPIAEYRWLRWPLGAIAAGGSQAVRARVRVSNTAVAARTER
jgi:uncharacterized repeat protein (TIGR01451 family)